MNIIVGTEQADLMRDKYTVLELDTLRFEQIGFEDKAYCVLEKTSLFEMNILEDLVKFHNELIAGYQNRQWQYCLDAIDQMIGKFNGEMDSFYLNLKSRCEGYLENPPGPDWTHVVSK